MTDGNLVHGDFGKFQIKAQNEVEFVVVPAKGIWIVSDGRIIQAHKVRKEADYLLNYCTPEDPCGAEDGCNTDE